jgi:uncharacterized protein YdiU (UPF0061 family)
MIDLPISSDFTSSLPGEENPTPFPHQVENAMWSAVTPVTASRPQLIHWSADMADRLGIDFASLGDEAAQLFTGSKVVSGSTPYSMRYGGHQFGNWAGQLGDGRAIALGEMNDRDGQHWVLQLKGAGPTPYSRQGDGLAVLRSSIREYLCSEAMYHLGIPTTRSLSLCTTGDQVPRDIFYDGNVTHEPGAILCRVAHSFVRFGSFEIHAAHKEHELLKSLADHVITRNYPHLVPADGALDEKVYLKWFEEIVQRTAELMAQWQRVGFVHAVMNTDNMSILGQTIDYGPYGWLEEYDPTWTPNFIDQQGRRYSYGNQPSIGLWNLYRLANAILPLINNTPEPLTEILDTYESCHDSIWRKMVAGKLGITDFTNAAKDNALGDTLWETMTLTPTDFTVFFSQLATAATENLGGAAHAGGVGAEEVTDTVVDAMYDTISQAFYEPGSISVEAKNAYRIWLKDWAQRIIGQAPQDTSALMAATNPRFILRNYLSQQIIDQAERGDYSLLDQAARWVQTPYEANDSEYQKIRPDWATAKPGCTMLTCSS